MYQVANKVGDPLYLVPINKANNVVHECIALSIFGKFCGPLLLQKVEVAYFFLSASLSASLCLSLSK